ncbi:sulfite exporter TauE/SafE family protein [Massilia terrae]|uniref:Probable membrane transporter protein n=1 Tax=Massilia terrae TaxID=1811224 RepID=A0ABT2D1M5_9BURK|nr:sulfite exporter TauE/SafE family protein [Massilia terrae]MCS0660133.1 sulfite exporter TauE/SafE family protein [Massilia terrae]
MPGSLGLGLVVGIILALTGAGGGILAVPLLIFGTGIGVAQAGPIGLLAVGMAAVLGALLGLRAGVVRYRAALLIAATGMVLSPAGLWLARRVDNRWLGIVFALTLLYVAVMTYRRAGAPVAERVQVPVCVRDGGSGRFIWTRPCARAMALSGALAGLLSGLLGVGGGFVMVPALQRYTDLPMKSVVATSLAVIALVSMTGVAATAVSGHMDWQIAAPFSAGALAGMLGGRAIASRLAGPHLQKGFAAISAVVAVCMIGKAFA